MKNILLASLALTFSIAATPQTPHHSYRAADGTYVRSPYHYKRHPHATTTWTATCRNGSLSFARSRSGACSHHQGIAHWNKRDARLGRSY